MEVCRKDMKRSSTNGGIFQCHGLPKGAVEYPKFINTWKVFSTVFPWRPRALSTTRSALISKSTSTVPPTWSCGRLWRWFVVTGRRWPGGYPQSIINFCYFLYSMPRLGGSISIILIHQLIQGVFSTGFWWNSDRTQCNCKVFLVHRAREGEGEWSCPGDGVRRQVKADLGCKVMEVAIWDAPKIGLKIKHLWNHQKRCR